MSVGHEAFGIVQVEVDEAVDAVTPADEWPSWLVTANGDVYRVTLHRRRPNGTVWFEGTQVDVEGWGAPGLCEKLAAARELAEWTCTKARIVMQRLALNGAAS